MPAPPSTKQKAANQMAMNKAKANSTSFGGINTSTVKTSDRGSTNRYGANPAQRPSGGGLLAGGGGNNFGGINTGLLRSQTSAPSPLMQKAMERHRANLLGQQAAPDPRFNVGVIDTPRLSADPTNGIGRVNPMAPQAPMGREQMDARVNAVSRGPGSVAGVMPGASLLSQQRTLLGLSGAMSEGGMPIGPRDLQRLSATVAGEAGNQGPMGQTAAANTMLNRIALAEQNPGKFGYMGGGDINSLMGQYDATGMRKNTTPNRAFRNAQLGTDSLGEGIASIAGAASPNSQFNTTAPENIRNATHFLTRDAQLAQSRRPPGPSNWSNDPNRPFTAMGAHLFGNAEPIGQQVAAARGQPPATPTQVASINPAMAPPQTETGTDWFGNLKKGANQAGELIKAGYNEFTEANQMINKIGPEAAVKLAKVADSIMNFLPGGKVDNSRYTDRTTEGVKNSQNPGAAPPVVAPVSTPVTPQAMPPLPPQFYPQYSQMWANLPTGRV